MHSLWIPTPPASISRCASPKLQKTNLKNSIMSKTSAWEAVIGDVHRLSAHVGQFQADATLEASLPATSQLESDRQCQIAFVLDLWVHVMYTGSLKGEHEAS